MSMIMERAKSSWLLAFGDVVTLLITFFIMMIALNKGEITKLQKWVDQQITSSYQSLQLEIDQRQLEIIQVERSARGIVLTIQSDNAFQSGRFQPSEQLLEELNQIAPIIAKAPLFNYSEDSQSQYIINRAAEEGMQWFAEIVVEGHTDNDRVDPFSALRNNYFLSTLRAQAVMQQLFLQSQLPADLFSVAGYGEWQPIADNTTDLGKQQNRRVEVIINASFQRKLEI